ncbi:hypothetical protein MesoLj113a_42220 [Mesorhizobium sp. 113-1-2]|nr:hypothetical protein MesoLj113a_42220 [Mesorhizobium sp. 113-1-2]
MLKRFRSALVVAIATAWIAAVAANTLLDNTYVGYPRVTDPDRGLIIPYNVKGIVVYVTSEQMYVLSILRHVTIISGILMVMLVFINYFFPFRKNDKPTR